MLRVLCTLVLSAAAAAQTTTTLVTDTDAGFFAGDGTNTTLKSAKKGTAVTMRTPLRLNAMIRGANAGGSAGMVRGGAVFGSFGRVASQSTKGTAGTTATTDPKSVKQGPHSFLLTITNPGFQSLDLFLSSRITGKPTASASVDVGADGNVELKQAADGKSYLKRVRFTGRSVKVRVTMDGSAGPGTSYGMTVMVTRSTPGCRISRFGTPCRRTMLAARDMPASGNHVLTLQVMNAIANKPVAIAVGAATARTRLPGSPCFLLTTPLVVVPLTADRTGKAQLQVKFPLSTKGTGYLQAIPYDPQNNVIMASNGLRVDCL